MSEPANQHSSARRNRRTVGEGSRLLPERVRDLPEQIVRTAVIGLNQALRATEKVQSEWGYLQQHGVGPTLDRLRGALAASPTLGRSAQDTWGRATGTPAPGTEAEDSPAAPPSPPEASPQTREAAAAPDQLPIPDYDEASVPSLRARLRTLTASEVETLLAYERNHQNRQTVVTMFENRIHKLRQRNA